MKIIIKINVKGKTSSSTVNWCSDGNGRERTLERRLGRTIAKRQHRLAGSMEEGAWPTARQNLARDQKGGGTETFACLLLVCERQREGEKERERERERERQRER